MRTSLSLDQAIAIVSEKLGYSPSSYQRGILEHLVKGQGNAACNAVAGAGKSSTLQMAAIVLEQLGFKPSEIRIMVFGKANAQDLIKKFGTAWKDSISTLHSAGWSLIKQELSIKNTLNLIKPTKYKKIAQGQGLISPPRSMGQGTLRNEGAIDKDADFLTLVDLIRMTNSEPTEMAVREVCDHFEIADVWRPAIVAEAIKLVLKIGEEQALNKVAFDYCDQIWLPVKWDLGSQKWFEPYQFVLVDECQDLNAAQLELALMLAGKKGRLLFVGDPNQAIMGFSGSDNRSYQKIVDRAQCVELPLSTCYRCPSEHIKLVQRIFPSIPIEARENAPQGSIVQCSENELETFLKTGDLVISRKTAPLVSLCIRLIAKGIKATVKGKAIGDQIKKDLDAISEIPGFVYSEFNAAIDAYRQTMFSRYEGLDNEEQLKDNLTDKLEALQTIYTNRPNAKSIGDLELYIDSMFSDDSSPITLSTCHRAKGLEGERIFIHKAEDMPMKWKNQQDWQYEQERNLLYVALTRSKSELFIVGNPDWLLLDDEVIEEAEPQSISDPRLKLYVDYEQEDRPPSTVSKQWVNLGLIKLDTGTQLPSRRSELTIADYAEQMEAEQWDWKREPLPILFDDGSGTLYPGDGHHRTEAAGLAQKESIYAEIRPGGLLRAKLYSAQANRFHGLKLTRKDKRSKCEMIFADPELLEALATELGQPGTIPSDRVIADYLGVSAPLVGDVRKEFEQQGTVNISSERVDRSGRKLNTEKIGKKSSSLPEERSEKPLPQLEQNGDRPESPSQSGLNGNLAEPISHPQVSQDLVESIAQPMIKDRTAELTEKLSAPVKKTDPTNQLSEYEQGVIEGACKVWSAKTVIQFAIRYATEDEMQKIYALLGTTIKQL